MLVIFKEVSWKLSCGVSKFCWQNLDVRSPLTVRESGHCTFSSGPPCAKLKPAAPGLKGELILPDAASSLCPTVLPCLQILCPPSSMHRIPWSLGAEVTLRLILLQLSSPKVWIEEEVVEVEGAAQGHPSGWPRSVCGGTICPVSPMELSSCLGDTSPAQFSGF